MRKMEITKDIYIKTNKYYTMANPTKRVPIDLDQVVIKFSGDSGDGMQLTGTFFSNTAAILGNDVSTFPDYPSEIRAPQGTIGGVSGFQVHIGNKRIYTPGDHADVLVAMNPAALKQSSKVVKAGGTIIVDIDAFDDKNMQKAGFKTEDPIVELGLDGCNVIKAPITSFTKESLTSLDMDNKSVLRCKNMFALGLVSWLFNRPLKETEGFVSDKFKKKPILEQANTLVLNAGYNYGEVVQELTPSYQINASDLLKKGKYRNISGNQATAWGLIAAQEKSGLPLFLGSYPITPATEILHELAARKDLGVTTFQAEDEIAGVCTAIGASYAGKLAATSTSGPGLALKAEAIGLAVMAELPLVIVNVQRGGPSTGLPTKTEQSDLMQAIYGRNGDSPCIVLAASTPSNCFNFAFKAAQLALEHMTPVILLTDGFLANGSQPFLIPDVDADFPTIKAPKVTPDMQESWSPYLRDSETLARYWATPGTPGFIHRIGGLEKDNKTGNLSHDPENHQVMTELREEKVQRVANYIPELEVEGNPNSKTLLVGWGGTYGHLLSTAEQMNAAGTPIALAHFNYIKPLPKNTKEIFSKYDTIIVCELNLGQFANYLRMTNPEFNYKQINKIQGAPFRVEELIEQIIPMI